MYQPLLDYFSACTEAAAFHPLNHLTLSVDAVSEEAAALSEAWNAYMMPLLCGLSENIDDELDAAILKLKEAGLDRYIAEIQRQLDDYAASY